MRIGILIIALALMGCAAAPVRGTPAVMDGTDPASGTVIDPITLWQTYDPRGPKVGSVRHGARVTLVRVVGQGAEIMTADGVRGWCNAACVRP